MSDEKTPTGGSVVIGPGGTSEWKRFYDEPLTRDEQKATAWFNELSPNEQYREVRRMKWNLEEITRSRDAWKNVAERQAKEISELMAKVATFTPDGFQLPATAGDLLTLAEEHGWKTTRAWTVNENSETARLYISLHNPLWTIKLAWSADKGGGARRYRSGLISGLGQPWRDAPSFKVIKKLITDSTTKIEEN
jgi:hypothetical protein